MPEAERKFEARTVTISGVFTEADFRELQMLVRRIEQRHPDTSFSIQVNEPVCFAEAVRDFLARTPKAR